METPKAVHSSLGTLLSDHDFVDEAYMDLFLEGSLSDEDYAVLLQAQCNSVDTPTGIESLAHNKYKASIELSDHDFVDEKVYMDLFQEGLIFDDEYAFSNKNKSVASSSSHNLSSKMPRGASSSSSAFPWYPPESSNSRRKYNVSGRSGHHLKIYDLESNLKRAYSSDLENKSYGKDKLNLTEYSSAPKGSVSSTKDHKNQDGLMKNSQLFKQFDTVEDFSDHFYLKNGSAVKQQSKNWAKRIQDEWKILGNDLPNAIFIRAYESRMDLMRAVIVGAQGTPYHDGLFFFDILFPSDYPSVPPHVHYHSGGLRINPNLYDNGKVCLSLLNTWNGSGNEKWIPNGSTLLQVLVSIQALILNEKPYFNEPGFASSAGTAAGEQNSQSYSENAFIMSLKTMVYTIRKPPRHFEELVTWHFRKYAQDILGACKVYMESGVQVGGKTIHTKAQKCSTHFQANVSSHIAMLVQAFVQIGATDCN